MRLDRRRLIPALEAARRVRSWGRVRDIVTIMLADSELDDVAFSEDPNDFDTILTRLQSTNEKTARIARAIRSGRDIPGCGDPACSDCRPKPKAPPDANRVYSKIEFSNGVVIELDTPLIVRPGDPVFFLMPCLSE